MTLSTFRFGEIEFAPDQVHRFPEGLPGLEHLHEFIFVRAQETEPLFWLQSIEDPQVALPVGEAFSLAEDYALDIAEEDLSLLEIERPEDVMVLFVVVIPEQIHLMTANLAAPIILQRDKRLGKQIYAANPAYSVRHPIFEVIMRTLEGGQADAGTIQEGE